MKSRGYSNQFKKEINALQSDSAGVRLAKLCVAKEVPVAYVAQYIGLSRPTVYSWFRGATKVPPKHMDKVGELIASLEK